MKPGQGVTALVGADGCLDLLSEQTGLHHHCDPVATAMWIALWQHDGRPDLAANTLARHWEADSRSTRLDLDTWLDELRGAGLVCDDR